VKEVTDTQTYERQAKWSLPSEAIRSDNLQLLQKHELLTKLAGGKKRVETDRERKVRVKLLLIEQELARERREAEAKQKKEAARLAREQGKSQRGRSGKIDFLGSSSG